MWTSFKAFIARGNVMDLAVGIIVGTAFNKIVSTLVDGVVMPPIGLVLRRVNFSDMMFVLDHSRGLPASLSDAKAKSIPVIAYGQLITDVISFLVISFVVFVLVREVNKLKSDPPPSSPTTRACPYCLTSIPLKATRCPACTSDLGAVPASV